MVSLESEPEDGYPPRRSQAPRQESTLILPGESVYIQPRVFPTDFYPKVLKFSSCVTLEFAGGAPAAEVGGCRGGRYPAAVSSGHGQGTAFGMLHPAATENGFLIRVGRFLSRILQNGGFPSVSLQKPGKLTCPMRINLLTFGFLWLATIGHGPKK